MYLLCYFYLLDIINDAAMNFLDKNFKYLFLIDK